MYLKEIKAQGFKSFADKINIELTSGITGIVGPNGSGKSNVVDAVRWVLGEQSVKSLRGDGNMADVIFSGSKSRHPMNIASVELIFDNKDNYLPLSFDEVSIKRRVYRDGNNEYFINNEKVRLKDITNLLLDGGIAKESFNIISQGKIESIISSKPADRRDIFEEAAGVLKYKRRKEEAIRKIDKTDQNLDRVGDIIKELEPQIEPLRQAKEDALLFKKTQNQLEKIELAVITEDITKLNYDYQKQKQEIEILNDELLKISTSNSESEAKEAQIKNEILKVDNQIKQMQNSIIKLVTETEKLNSQKAIIKERQNYEVDNAKLHNQISDLKEQSMKISNEISLLETDITNISKNISDRQTKEKQLNSEIERIKKQKQEKESKLTNFVREKHNLEIKIDTLKNNIENGGSLPISVKSVLNNPKLNGIHDIVGNLIEVEEKYSVAISTALGFSLNNIVVDNEKCAKEAINYLKSIGRATFLPLNIIKSKYVDEISLDIIKAENYFIKVASKLIKCEDKYKSIIENQLGNILIVDNIDNATNLSRKLKFKYRIITLDGSVINVGGSLTGGKNTKIRNTISDRYELEDAIRKTKDIDKNIDAIENTINEYDYNLKSLEDKVYLLSKEIMLQQTKIQDNNKNILDKKEQLQKINLDINSTSNIIQGALSKEEEEIIEKYYKTLNEKEVAEKQLEVLNKDKNNLTESLEDYMLSLKKENAVYNEKVDKLKKLEINVNRLDVKLDNLLNSLSENYSMTYEKAKENYKLDIDYTSAKNEVNILKRKIKEIGIVNLAAPEEYDRINERYEFLVKQVEDLNKAKTTLLEIISEMDKVMALEFAEAFNEINNNFESTFKLLFKGGSASLKLTEPNKLLTTGIEIIASPPGKKLTSISLLSGGEKTLTAISLLFAIIQAKPSAFCILDEVEAALDDVNVDAFGQYVKKLKQLSQFIIITHKKKTMEYADVLYGITMQESGVSKLASVKLEDR